MVISVNGPTSDVSNGNTLTWIKKARAGDTMTRFLLPPAIPRLSKSDAGRCDDHPPGHSQF
ncbi:protein of unknown function [Aminobacter niigataensis]|nr:protein of unknown function [Aminobacter niigataensis]